MITQIQVNIVSLTLSDYRRTRHITDAHKTRPVLFRLETSIIGARHLSWLSMHVTIYVNPTGRA